MDADDLLEYDLLFSDDEPPRRQSGPQPPDPGPGCITGCILAAVVVLLTIISS